MTDLDAILKQVIDEKRVPEEKVAPALSAEESRLVRGFAEITAFVEREGRIPVNKAGASPFEKIYRTRLEVIQAHPQWHPLLGGKDARGLLTADLSAALPPIAKTDMAELIGQVAEKDGADDSIFTLRHVRTRDQIQRAEEIAGKELCPDFDTFKPLFDQVVKDLEDGNRESERFTNEREIREGQFFILKGVLCYVADRSQTFEQAGRPNERLRLIFANGTQSRLLSRSLAAELYKPEAKGRRISPRRDHLGPLFEGAEQSQTGSIYVLRSLSNDPYMQLHRHSLFKIGVTTGSVARRISRAETDPTYLLAPVEVALEAELHNVRPSAMEKLLHTFFQAARADVEIKDRFGTPVQPREWFHLTLDSIEKAIGLIRDETLHQHHYNIKTARIEALSD